MFHTECLTFCSNGFDGYDIDVIIGESFCDCKELELVLSSPDIFIAVGGYLHIVSQRMYMYIVTMSMVHYTQVLYTCIQIE